MSRRSRATKETGSRKPDTFHVERTAARHRPRQVPLHMSGTSAEAAIHLSPSLGVDEQLPVESEQEPTQYYPEELRNAFHQDPFPTESLDDRVESILEDYAETYLKESGQGQNSMLREWLRDCSPAYLREFYKRYEPPQSTPCACTVPVSQRYRCDDCLGNIRFCSECLLDYHRYSPTHRIAEWNGETWSKTTLKQAGLVFELGRHSDCTSTHTRDMSLGDISGYHDIRVSYCRCRGIDLTALLIRGGFMPCSDFNPRSAFTIRSLRIFDILAADSKLSASRFHTVLQRQTNNILPDAQPDRLRELLRVTREYLLLQLLKRTGQVVTTPKELGCLAVRCPACPRLGFNYKAEDIMPGFDWLFAQLISYDGSFQLVRKNKAYNDEDICLTDRLLYFVSQVHYAAHLEANKDTAYEAAMKGDQCNNHRAAGDTWVRQTGVAETGLGSVTCARHTVFMPQGTVNYWKGERFVATDFGVGGVIQLLMSEGADNIGVFYDIFCRWGINFWDRAPNILLPSGPLTQPAWFFGGVPKYHLAAHIDSCFARFSLNNMLGVGRLDAEGCERAWASLNQAAGSTSEKGPGAWIDSINHCMNDWNWRKLTSMVGHVIRHYPDAVEMAVEQEELWSILDNSISPTLTAEWGTRSTEATKVNGVWTSVFLMSNNKGSSRLKKAIDLNLRESTRLSDEDLTEPGLTAPIWLSEGLDIEKIQVRLYDEIKKLGEGITPKQSLDLTAKRTSLASRISSHRSHVSLFMDIRLPVQGGLEPVSKATEGRPELADLYLPSHIFKNVALTERSLRVISMEQDLRRAECYETLRNVRTAAMQKSQTIQGKNRHARGESANTRGQSMVTWLETCIAFSRQGYNRSFKALITLGVDRKTLLPLQELKTSDFQHLHKILTASRELPQGTLKLPWFWQVRESIPGEPDISEQEEFAEAIRVEWFRGRERFRRYKEEAMLLRRELASTLFDFRSRAEVWDSLSKSTYSLRNPGYRAYCLCQRDTFLELLRDGFTRGKHVLEADPAINICTRALRELS